VILRCQELGEGPPIALLHGLFGRGQNLASLARRLARRRRVISVDMPNHGASPHTSDMRYETMAADVRETLAALGAWPSSVLGHSMGGKAAMMLALLHPDGVEKLIVADIAPVRYEHRNRAITDAMQSIVLAPGLTRAEADRALASAVPEPAVRGFLLQNLVFSESPCWRLGLKNIANSLENIQDFPESSAGLTYDGAAWFIIGGDSDFVEPEHHGMIRRFFPAAHIVTIKQAGHWLHADQPDAFAAAVEQALL
jgi:pimeloyl-ACP methyl ester carboxylesterase